MLHEYWSKYTAIYYQKFGGGGWIFKFKYSHGYGHVICMGELVHFLKSDILIAYKVKMLCYSCTLEPYKILVDNMELHGMWWMLAKKGGFGNFVFC